MEENQTLKGVFKQAEKNTNTGEIKTIEGI